jgi:hypothetical protein
MKTGTEGSRAYFRTKGFKGPRSLIKEIQRDAFVGIGKPEPLKQALSGYWSRRITEGTPDRLQSRSRCRLYRPVSVLLLSDNPV